MVSTTSRVSLSICLDLTHGGQGAEDRFERQGEGKVQALRTAAPGLW
ncbi:hypothetical protein [uncultured Arthrobacter sp.]|nr:hypothetical protein [uncultured Arthrobacter sp.]